MSQSGSAPALRAEFWRLPVNAPQLFVEEGRLPAEQIVRARFGLDGVLLDRIHHHLERLLQFDETLNEACGVLEVDVVVHEPMGDQEGVFQPLGVVDRTRAVIRVGVLVG